MGMKEGTSGQYCTVQYSTVQAGSAGRVEGTLRAAMLASVRECLRVMRQWVERGEQNVCGGRT